MFFCVSVCGTFVGIESLILLDETAVVGNQNWVDIGVSGRNPGILSLKESLAFTIVH